MTQYSKLVISYCTGLDLTSLIGVLLLISVVRYCIRSGGGSINVADDRLLTYGYVNNRPSATLIDPSRKYGMVPV